MHISRVWQVTLHYLAAAHDQNAGQLCASRDLILLMNSVIGPSTFPQLDELDWNCRGASLTCRSWCGLHCILSDLLLLALQRLLGCFCRSCLSLPVCHCCGLHWHMTQKYRL